MGTKGFWADPYVLERRISMAGRGRKKGEEISSKSRAWKVGVYGRRSFDDGETEESYTITNQKKMIEYFVSNYSDMKIIDYYSDEGIIYGEQKLKI